VGKNRETCRQHRALCEDKQATRDRGLDLCVSEKSFAAWLDKRDAERHAKRKAAVAKQRMAEARARIKGFFTKRKEQAKP
jgi:hypothetical protein